MQDEDKPEVTLDPKDAAWDILSHPMRKNRVHILTLDSILGTDIHIIAAF